MRWSPVGRIRVGASKSEEMKELLSRVADLPVHFTKEALLFPFPRLLMVIHQSIKTFY